MRVGHHNHIPIFLQVDEAVSKPPSPFKFNSHWLKDPKFKDLVQSEWKHIKIHMEYDAMFQFSESLNRIKRKIIEWAKGKYKDSQECQLWTLEEDIANIFKSNKNGVFSEEELGNFKQKKASNKVLLDWKEAKWRPNSKSDLVKVMQTIVSFTIMIK
jgi:hypothetical protein